MQTRLDRLLRAKNVSTARVAQETGYHRNHISRVRAGRTEPTRECMAAILSFVKRNVDPATKVEDLFDFPTSNRRAAS